MIRLTKLTDYGIVLLTHFASSPPASVHTAREIAQTARLPLPTVGRLLKVLTSEGLLVSQRGVNGGYSLARPAEEISISQIIRALEGPVSMTECSDGPGICKHELLCPLKTNWQKINDVILRALEGISLAEMARPFTFDLNLLLSHDPSRTLTRRT